jgi:site-specific recombinase XerD
MKYKLYAKSVRGQENFVYLYIYHNVDGSRLPRLTSLSIKIPVSACSPSKQEFRKVVGLSKDYLIRLGFDSVKNLNDFLQERLNNYIKTNGKINFVSEERKTLNYWFTTIINRQLNQGTKMRYQNVFNLLLQFQRWYTLNEKKQIESDIIYMKDIDLNYLLLFKNWLRSEPNENERRKKNKNNSTNFKLKCLKSILNKAHNEKYYAFIVNPFDHISFTFQEQNYEILSLEELNKLIEVDLIEVYRRTIPKKDGTLLWGKEIEGGVEERNKRNKRYKAKHTLNDIRNYFLFQLLSQGIRVSDLVTLRWNNFQQNDEVMRINKIMVKTRKSISILVNDKMTSLISHYIIRYKDFFPDEIQRLVSINDDILKEFTLYNRKSSVVRPQDENWRHFHHIIDETSKYGITSNNQRGLLVDFDTIKKLQDFLLERNVDGTLHQYLNDGKPYRKMIDGPIQIGKLIMSLENWHRENIERNENRFSSEYKELKQQRHELVISLIRSINTIEDINTDFVFPLLDNRDFKNIDNDDFSELSEPQYRKFQSVRCYYNKLLKLVAAQANINKRLTSHLSRHSYASLMMDIGENVNLYDLMTSLGHRHLSTTQIYIQRMSNTKIDKLNLVISDKLNSNVSINL